MEIAQAWEELKEKVSVCNKCELCKTRNNTVFGEGPVENSPLVIVGEAPGADEDATGRPFIGKAGELLTGILEKGGKIKRDSVYVTNVIKCRPPDNRDPKQQEMLACGDFLEAQLLLLRPEIIVTMGNISTKWLLKTKRGITQLRGQWFEWRGIKLFPMFHPSYLLRNETSKVGGPKYLTWQDVQALRKNLRS